MRTATKLWTALFLLATATVSCSGPRKAPAPAATQPADAGTLISYHRTGGVGGTDDWVLITADGGMKVSGRQFGSYATQLPKGAVGKLEDRAFQGWERLDARYPAPYKVRDAYQYEIRYGGKTVTASEASQDVPRDFSRAQLAVEGLAKAFKPAPGDAAAEAQMP